ncbi:helix-turn-helix domain-containing protein [Qipengyuania sp.]|uniref:AraC family transcriptional regulator n=1 Tax=Qipengyuania sp. TaxID=2004515 RepID=UPI0035C842E4
MVDNDVIGDALAVPGNFAGNLTPQALFTLDYHPPPPVIADFVTTLYHFRCDELMIRDFQPAAVGHLMVFLRGHGVMRFAGGRVDPSHPVSLMTPCGAAVPIEVEGPFHCIGAALSPLGWAALTGLHAGEWADKLLPARDYLGEDVELVGQELIADYLASSSGAELCQRLAQCVSGLLRPVNSRHATLIGMVAEWLGSGFDPSLEALFERSAYSRRQTQRLVERYFGLPPRELKRKYRALRVISLLSQPDLSEEEQDELADCFYDQSHMIREIRHFVGRTPGDMVGDNQSILSALIDVRNFREIPPQVAALPEARKENDSQ